MGNSQYRRASADKQADLLRRCYDYAYQSAKADVLGADAADGWVRNAQISRRDLGISMTDYFFYYEKYGAALMSGSGYEKTKRMVAAGLSVDEWAAFKSKVDANDSGSVTKAEVTDYIEAHFSQDQWSALFDAYMGGSNWKNPYAA